MISLAKYEILEKIGQGGMGVVYRCRHVELGTILALKMLPPELATDPELIARFRREARVMAGLDHRNIVRVFDLVQEGGAFYLVMEYLRGKNLSEHLHSYMAIHDRPLPVRQVLQIGVEVCAALVYAHEQDPAVVHRDIKPANIILDDETGRAVLTDFGIAKIVGDSQTRLTRTGMFVGTLEFSAPEQIRHEPDVDGRADIYSLGMVLYELYTGRRFFAGMTDQEIIGSVLYGTEDDESKLPESEPQLAHVIRGAIARDRFARYGSAQALLLDLQACLAASGDGGEPAPPRGDDASGVPGAPGAVERRPAAALWEAFSTARAGGSEAVDFSAEQADTRRTATLRRRLAANVRYLAVRWWIVASVVPAFVIAVLCTTSGLSWIGQPFPGFFIMENAVVPTAAAYHWTGRKAGLPNHGVIESAAGDVIVASNALYALAEALPLGTPIEYRVRKNGDDRTIAIATMLFTPLDYALTFGLLGLNGIVIIFTGFVVALLSPKNGAARVFFVMSLMMGLYPVTGADLWRDHVFTPMQLALQCLAPATFIHLALVFPVERTIGGRLRPLVIGGPYALGAALAVWLMHGFWAKPVDLLPLYVGYAYSAFGLVVLVASGLLAYAQYRRHAVRGRVQVVMVGVVLAFLLPIAGFLNNMLGGGDFPLNLIAFTPIVFFVAVAYAIVKHKLFDTQIFIRRSVMLACLLGGFTTLYVAAITLLSSLLANRGFDPHSPGFMGGFMALSLASALPLRDQLSVAIERRLFPHKYRSHQTINLLCRSIARTDDLETVLDEATRGLASAMQLTAGGVLLRSVDGGSFRMAASFGIAPPTYVLSADSPLVSLLVTTRREVFADDLREDVDLSAIREACLLHLDALQAELVIPLLSGGVMVGVLSIGRHPVSDILTSEDLQLLRSLAAGLVLAAVRSADVFRTQQLTLQRRVLEHYLPPPAIQALLGREPGSPVATREPFTSLSVRLEDVSGAVGMTDPEILSERLRDFYALCRAHVRDFGGTVERCEGDRVRAMFRAGSSDANDATRAVEAAIAIRNALELKARQPNGGAGSANVAAGLARGVGNVVQLEVGSREIVHCLGSVGTCAERASERACSDQVLADRMVATTIAPPLAAISAGALTGRGMTVPAELFELRKNDPV